MSDKIIIIGNSHFAEIIYQHLIQDTDWSVVAFAADKAYIQSDELCQIPVIAIEDMNQYYSPSEVTLVMAVGYGNGNKTREKLYHECISLGFIFRNFIHSSAYISSKICLGIANIVFPGVTIDSNVQIGNGNIILPQVMVGHDVTINNFCAVSGGTCLGGGVSIGDKAFLGMGTIVKDKVSIASDAYIGAGCYIHKNVKQGQCVMASQSRYLDERESEILKSMV